MIILVTEPKMDIPKMNLKSLNVI